MTAWCTGLPVPLKLSGHAQMDTPNAAVGFQLGHQVFAPSGPVTDTTASDPRHKMFGSAGTGNRPTPAHLNSINLK